MRLTRRSRLALILGLLIAGWLGYAYWQISQVDPEGGCKEFKYLSVCTHAWVGVDEGWITHPWHFRLLPTDKELIDRFKKYRTDFDAMANETIGAPYLTVVDLKWKEKHGIYLVEGFADYPQTPSEKEKHSSRTWAYSFPVASTRYVSGASSQDLASLLREKSYVYYHSPPRIEDGYVLSLSGEDGKPINKMRVLPSLDGPPWPLDWKSDECLLRRIEPQWFLALCRDRVGG